MITEDEVYQIGVITRTHGVRGELSFMFTDDVWDRVDADYLVLRIDGILVPFFLEEWRFRSDSAALVKFEDIDDANAAAVLVGSEVYFPKALTPKDIYDDELTWRMLAGFTVLDASDAIVGTITSVDESTINVILYITRPEGGEFMLPAVEEFIRDVDYKARTLHAEIPADLLTLNL
ncbi:MAG: ribosome maturation factor RimM [Bacteroidaceae bacterium]|nr:ribosome maturation factor RimM [Bacteroidaceae bacterium]